MLVFNRADLGVVPPSIHPLYFILRRGENNFSNNATLNNFLFFQLQLLNVKHSLARCCVCV